MRTDLVLNPWEILSSSREWYDDFLESIFFTGNGRMGVRGYLPFEEEARGIEKGLYLAGIFGEIKPGITDLVNLPTPAFEKLCIDGSRAVLCSDIKRRLNMKNCTLSVSFSMAPENRPDCKVHVNYERFFPFDSPAIMLQRTVLSSDTPVSVKLISGLSVESCNSPVPDDQTKQNNEIMFLASQKSLLFSSNGFAAGFEIRGTGISVSELIDFSVSSSTCKVSCEACQESEPEFTAFEFCAELGNGQQLIVDKAACIETSRDIDPRISTLPLSWSYEEYAAENSTSWNKLWDTCDFAISDPELQSALRFNMMGLITSCSRCDSSVSIGARGLTHGRYKGCYFWDTDVFMLPFFLENDLTAAKSLLEYRVRMLPAAKEHSKKMNTKGARYPWMSSYDGSEQCESWDIGCSEVHITADIVYAMDCYHQKSGDDSFYLNEAAEVYIETARFWLSRYSWDPDHKTARLLFVKGPDEYCGITTNNMFTNVLVKLNLELAMKAAADLKDKCPDIYARLQVSDEEVGEFKALHDAITIPRDPVTGHLTTDETFHLLEPVDLKTIKANDSASYHDVCFDRLQRYKVVKQADVLLIMTRLPKLFTEQEKKDAWYDFEPICLHDSTLSFASHALFALQNGFTEQGMNYLRKALLIDLRDIMMNTGHEGLHLASMGESWQAATYVK